MSELTFHHHFEITQRYADDRLALIDRTQQWTRRDINETCLRLTNSMHQRLGLTRSDRFAVMSLNSAEYLTLWYASFLGGGIINPLNVRFSGPELVHVLADSGSRAVFVDAYFGNILHEAIKDHRDVLAIEQVILMGEGDAPCDLRFADLIDGASTEMPAPGDENDPAVLMYTGGTTGPPKGVLTTQRNQLLNIYHGGIAVAGKRRMVALHKVPMFHAHALGGILGVAPEGFGVIVPYFEPGMVLDAIEGYGVTRTTTVPTMLAMLLDHPDFSPQRLQSLETIIYGASPMPMGILQRVQELLPHVELYQGYGSTETSSTVTILSPEDHAIGGDLLKSAGRPVAGVNVAVHDPTGNELPFGETGEVVIRGGNLMAEYWNQPEATAEALRDGWYHSGDAGYLDENGYLYLVDRVKDMIVTGAENVYSSEVEDAISTHPSVAQVAVIGIPHETWGEQVHAVIVLRQESSLTLEELQDHARKTIAGYKVPRSMEIVGEIPLSAAGKQMKRELRKAHWSGTERGVN